MAQINRRIIEDEKVWENFLGGRNDVNLLQSWYWGEFQARLGKKIFHTGFYETDTNQLIGVMLAIVEPARRGKYLTVPGGPVIDWTDSDLVEMAVTEIIRLAKDAGCGFARVRPQLLADETIKKIFSVHHFINAPIHLHAELTSELDITRSEAELWQGLRKTTRSEIKKAQNEKIVIATTTDPELIKDFYELQLATARRQGFVPFTCQFLHEEFRAFAARGLALLYTAKLNGEVLAQAMIIFYGKEGVYHYGASTEAGRRHPGAYLIQWEAIKEAKRRGKTKYNFWGVAPLQDKRHRFSGISVFKRGFGGTDYQYLPAQDLIINYPRYWVNLIIEKMRKKIRRV